MPHQDEVVGMAEIAGLLGVVRSYAYRLAEEDPDFPEPIAHLAAGRVWRRVDIERWARAAGREVLE